MNSATILSPKQALTGLQALFWGGLVAGVLVVKQASGVWRSVPGAKWKIRGPVHDGHGEPEYRRLDL